MVFGHDKPHDKPMTNHDKSKKQEKNNLFLFFDFSNNVRHADHARFFYFVVAVDIGLHCE